MPRGETKHLGKHQFKPGQSGNPSGRPKMTPKQKIIKKLTVEAFQACAEAVCTGNLGSLEAMKDDPDISALQVGIASALARAMREGDYTTIKDIVHTVTGKPPEELIIKSTNLNANLNATIAEAKVKAAMEKLEDEV